MRVAVIGGGISGLSAAWMLAGKHEVTLFDRGPWLGGHTHTVDVDGPDGNIAVDTGFIVFNDRTYPNFLAFLDALGIRKQNSDMSFSVRCDDTGIEYNGSTLTTLFARPANALSPGFLRMLRDIVRFNGEIKRAHEAGELDGELSLGDYVRQGRYGSWLASKYVGPMVAAIWSSSVEQAFAMPVDFFARFFVNHGLLDVTNRPQWYVVPGGSRRYVEVVAQRLGKRVRHGDAVKEVRREADCVRLTTESGDGLECDHVVIATHSDEALSLLADASDRERDILGAIGYQENRVVLHTDTSTLPRRRRAWASWNYHLPTGDAAPEDRGAPLTYNMNILQGLSARDTYCVSLNPSENAIREQMILGQWTYSHPVYSHAALQASARHAEISGVNHTSFCGAYWRNGFHEDGLVSAIEAVRSLGGSLDTGLTRG